MLTIVAETVDELYKHLLHRVMAYGEMTYPRGFTCKEISPCTTILKRPQMNVLVNPLRNASKAFMAGELLWILMGREDVEMISFYNSRIKDYSDDGLKFFGAYGPKVIAQLPYILGVLSKDPWSRQAIINIWRESPQTTKDVPCTTTFQFMQRPLGRLNLHVTMRSQDVWLGFPYDVHNFTCIQMLVASILGLQPGMFVLNQGSLHAYSQNFKEIQEAAKWKGNGPETFTPNSKVNSLKKFNDAMLLVEIKEHNIRTGNLHLALQGLGDPLLDQKLQWLYNHGAKKYETR